jgi:hypothetical protein
MNATELVKKYNLRKIEQNGKVGVAPLNGKPSATEIAYIRDHKDEIVAAAEAAKEANRIKFDAAPTAADIAYNAVCAAEAKYRKLENGDADNSEIIAARDAWWAAQAAYNAQYPGTIKPAGVNYNQGATNNPWNI